MAYFLAGNDDQPQTMQLSNQAGGYTHTSNLESPLHSDTH